MPQLEQMIEPGGGPAPSVGLTGVTGSVAVARGADARGGGGIAPRRDGGAGRGVAGWVEPSGWTVSPLHSRNAPHVPQKVAPCSFVAPQTLQTITPPSPRVGQSGQSNRHRRDAGDGVRPKPAPRAWQRRDASSARVAAPRRLPRMSAVTSLSRNDPTVDPGGQAAVTVKIRNAGSIVDRFDVDVVGPTAGWVARRSALPVAVPGRRGHGHDHLRAAAREHAPRRRLPVRDPRATGGGPRRLDGRGGADLGHAVHDRRGGHRPADVARLARRQPPGRRRQPRQRPVRGRRHRRGPGPRLKLAVQPAARGGRAGRARSSSPSASRSTTRSRSARTPAPVPGQGRARPPGADRAPRHPHPTPDAAGLDPAGRRHRRRRRPAVVGAFLAKAGPFAEAPPPTPIAHGLRPAERPRRPRRRRREPSERPSAASEAPSQRARAPRPQPDRAPERDPRSRASSSRTSASASDPVRGGRQPPIASTRRFAFSTTARDPMTTTRVCLAVRRSPRQVNLVPAHGHRSRAVRRLVSGPDSVARRRSDSRRSRPTLTFFAQPASDA